MGSGRDDGPLQFHITPGGRLFHRARRRSAQPWMIRVSTCSTSAPTPASRSRSPAKTVPSWSSIRTEAAEGTAPENTAAKQICLAKRSGRPSSRPSPQRMNLAATASSLGKSPLRSSVTRALHALFAPRSPHTPHSPTPVRVPTVSGAAGAKAISLQ